MERFGIVIDFQRRLVTVAGSTCPLDMFKEPYSRITVQQTVTVPPLSEASIACVLRDRHSLPPGEAEIKVERVDTSLAHAHVANSVAIMPAITASSSCIPVMILNASHAPITVRHGQIIALASPLSHDTIVASINYDNAHIDTPTTPPAESTPVQVASIIQAASDQAPGQQGSNRVSTVPSSSAPSTEPSAELSEDDEAPASWFIQSPRVTAGTSISTGAEQVKHAKMMLSRIRIIRDTVKKSFASFPESPARRNMRRAIAKDLMKQLIFPAVGTAIARPNKQAEHHIELNTRHPISVPQYRHSHFENEQIEAEVSKLLDQQLIEPSNSLYNAPLLLVRKASGGFRLVVDFRRLNHATLPLVYTMPTCSEILDSFGHSTVFSVIDISSAYHHIALSEDSKQYTAFTTPSGRRYQYKRLPFGLTDAPAVWQGFLEQLLFDPSRTGFTRRTLSAYMDDVVLYSPSPEQHSRDLHTLLQTLTEAGLSLNLSKCKLGVSEIDYLGHHVIADHSGGPCIITPNPGKIKAIAEFPHPTSRKAVKRFLGMATYYSRFLPHLSTIAAPLHSIASQRTSISCPFIWSSDHESAFTAIKTMLTSHPALRAPDYSKEFILQTDASGYGTGFLLMQEDADGSRYMVSCGSRTLNKAQRNWTASERECYAVLMGIRACRHYVYGKLFRLETDHKALETILVDSPTDKHGKLNRWSLALSEYQFHPHHRPGVQMESVDALSRAPLKRTRDVVMVITRARAKDVDTSNPPTTSDHTSMSSSVSSSPSSSSLQQAQPAPVQHVLPPRVAVSVRQSPAPTMSAQPQASSTSLSSSSLIQSSTSPLIQPSMQPVQPAVSIASPVSEAFQRPDLYRQTCKRLAEEQTHNNAYMHSMKQYLREGVMPSSVSAEQIRNIVSTADKWILSSEGILYFVDRSRRTGITRTRLFVPPSFREDLLRCYHDSPVSAHQGISRTFYRLAAKYVWPGMFGDVTRWVRACLSCAQRKRPAHRASDQIKQTMPISQLYQTVAADVHGPLTEGFQGERYVLVISDLFSREVELIALRDIKAETIARAFVVCWCLRRGAPRNLVTDNATDFRATLFKEVCRLLRVTHSFTTAYHPQPDGYNERTNRTLDDAIATMLTVSAREWPMLLPFVQWAINTSINQFTGLAPFTVIHGLDASQWIDSTLPAATELTLPFSQQLRENMDIMQQARQHILNRQEQKESALAESNKSANKALILPVGSSVMAYRPELTTSRKFSSDWAGPFTVVQRTGPNNYVIRLDNGKLQTYNVLRLKPFFPLVEFDLKRQQYQSELKQTIQQESALQQLQQTMSDFNRTASAVVRA
jgi:transposase InsO family protein